MKKPVIGIVAKNVVDKDMWHYLEIVDEIRYKLIQNGALVIGILPTDKKLEFKDDEELDQEQLSNQEKQDLESILNRLDGVILEGGLVSNQYEEEVVKICVEKDIPLLGICSGFNNIIRALGGTVHIDSNLFHNQYGSKIAHEVEIVKDSKLYDILQSEKAIVNSIHTCICNKEEIKEYRVVATCPVDHTVEAVELEDKRFIMGIKWHPELMDNMNIIFKKFIEECSQELEKPIQKIMK